MGISDTAKLLKDSLGTRIPQWWNSLSQSFSAVSDESPLPITQNNGVPLSFTGLTTNTLRYNIQKGQLNKFTIKPRIGNEYVEPSYESQSTITSTNIVGQIFKASADNISALSLTLESAAAISLDTFETYADSSALQAVWVANNTLAVLETTISDGGSKSIKLPLDVNADSWSKTISATNFVDYTGSFSFRCTDLNAIVKVFIGETTHTKSTTIKINNANEWVDISIDESSMTEDGAWITDSSAITTIGFIVDTKKTGASAYIDNLRATPPPGYVRIKLFDMGETLPESGVSKLTDGSQNIKINGISSYIDIQLIGGKRIYQLHNNFNVGVYKDDPSNELLTIGNYYALVLEYVDTDVFVYGPENSKQIKYYTNGYAFTASDESSAFSAIGPYSDIMFVIQSTDDIYIREASWRFDNSPNGRSDIFVFLENADGSIGGVLLDHEEHVPITKTLDVSNRPMLLTDGGKLEFYFNDDYTDGSTNVVISMTYNYQQTANNV